jgi:hypothetical protein
VGEFPVLLSADRVPGDRQYTQLVSIPVGIDFYTVWILACVLAYLLLYFIVNIRYHQEKKRY